MAGRALDQADAPVPEIQQVVGDDPGGALVVDLDAGPPVRIRRGRHPHIGDPRTIQGLQDHLVVADGGQQDHPVDRQAVGQGLHLRGEVRRGGLDLLHHQVEPALVTGPKGPQLGVQHIGAGVAQHEADLVGPRPRETPRRDLGPVAQLARDPQHLLAHFLAHVRLRVHHPRDRLHRDAGPAGHIGDGDRSHDRQLSNAAAA